MKVLNSGPSQPQLRNRAVPALTVALAALIAVVGAVFADAPDPKPEQASVRVGDVFIVNGVQVARVSVSGGWQWPTHHSDCNTNRTGAGYAIDWGDPNQSGNHVTTLDSIGSIDVGAASANAYNPADNEVHPTRPEEAGSLFNDPGQPAQYAQWRGGCGTYNGQFNTGVWGAVDLGSGQPVNCTSANSPSPTCLGGSHVYTLAALQAGVTICTIMYDVHGQDSNAGGAPNGAKEVTGGGSGHNGDNGAEKNGSTPLGNTCAPIPVPTPSSSPTPSPTPSGTPPQTATPTPPQTATPTPPQTATPTPPQTATPTPPQTATPTPPQTPTPTPSGTPTIHDLRCPVGTSRLIIQGTFDATYTDGTFVVSVNFRSSGQLEDFNSNLGVQELLVDGNGGTNRYQFNPPITFGSNFSEPTHGSINQTAFCYVRPGQTPTPTPPQTATPTPPQTPTPTPPQTPSPTPGQNASISGNVCLANNAFTNCPANGPISGVIIQLFNANTAQLVAQTGTDGNGHYVISNIPAGSYYLHEVQPAGPLDQGGCFPGNAGGFCTPVDLILGINLGSGVNATGYNFSEIPGTPVSPTPTPPVTPSPTPPGTATPPPSTPPPTPTASPTPGQGTLTGCVYVANDAVTVFPGNGPISGVTIHLLQSGNLN
ncbi:MAG TPA: SpaA isopeptide-forming pilin-related protein, partial [Candidatus Limnocylindria bacterium]|nr:SpaA isopeptide-forming pilin-related protein [Candidatus Limnocylindria bacterium]